MAKIITAKELAELVNTLLTNPESIGELDSTEQHLEFIREIGEAVANHCGGEIGGVHQGLAGFDGDESQPSLAVYPNDSLPSLTENVWVKYDPSGWEDEIRAEAES